MLSQTDAIPVLLIHGLAGHRLLMRPMSRALSKAGFAPSVWGYRSLAKDAQQHASELRRQIESLDRRCGQRQAGGQFHIVAHSLGAILTRIALQQYQPRHLSRIVMLGPPNQGSHVARQLSVWFGWLCQTMVDIADGPESLVRQLPLDLGDRFEVGIVLADNDYVVKPDSSRLPNVRDTTTCSGRHSGLLFSAEAFQQIETFLRTGQFRMSADIDAPDANNSTPIGSQP